MKSPAVFLLCFLSMAAFPSTSHAQQNSREGWHAGAGLGGYFYTTYWYYHRADGNPNHDNYAVHKLRRTVLTLDLEKRGLKSWGTNLKVKNQATHFELDAGGQLLLGFIGQTKADWLADEPVASSGGISIGFNANVKVLLILPPAPDLRIAPFVSLGPQFMMIHNNGKGLASPASESIYHYEDGWNEFLTNLVLGLGVNLEMGKMTLIPQLRLGLTGFGSSSWYPNGDGVSSDGRPGYWGGSISILRSIP